MSFKIWDKDLQGCSYTYETHEPLYKMAITGEKKISRFVLMEKVTLWYSVSMRRINMI
jgi:hypothetical protein